MIYFFRIYYLTFFIGLSNFFYAQEIKFIDAYGKPLDNRIVIIHGKETDTVSTNKRGTIYLKRKKDFDSISVFRNNHTLETKYKYELTENNDAF